MPHAKTVGVHLQLSFSDAPLLRSSKCIHPQIWLSRKKKPTLD